ncbi:MAG: preprotein translocase subunit YajC [Marinilabiliales bacterium]|nr:MAG: preprotein translocase subunit YajC [Marinilabiliales bacterium]
MNLAYILLMMPQGEGGEGGSGIMSFLPIILIVVVFWLFFIRPQSKKQREARNFRSNLKKGDRIITIGGIHGKIIEVTDNTVIVETEGQGKLKMEKSAIGSEYDPEKVARGK